MDLSRVCAEYLTLDGAQYSHRACVLDSLLILQKRSCISVPSGTANALLSDDQFKNRDIT